MIDYTLIKPAATKDEVIKLCLDAEKHRFRFVVVSPTYVFFGVANAKNKGRQNLFHSWFSNWR